MCRFDPSSTAGEQLAKNSVQKAIRSAVVDAFPLLEEHLEDILPRRAKLTLRKGPDRSSIIIVEGKLLFIQTRDHIFPTLRLLHKYPFMMPHMRVDKGAIRFVLNGSSIMCPGLTSPGGFMEEGVPANTAVAIMAEGKEHALAVGVTTMSTDEIRQVNSGIGIELIHHLKDPLWEAPSAPL